MELEESSPLLENKMTVSEIINNFGMGKFQWMLLFVIGLNAIGKKKKEFKKITNFNFPLQIYLTFFFYIKKN